MAWITIFYGALAFTIVLLLCNALRPGLIHIPGPFLAKFSNLYRIYLIKGGNYSYDILNLHRRYGHYVRLGPDVVSISDPQVIDRMYGLKNDFPKSDWVKSSQTLYQGQVVPALMTTQDKDVHSSLKRTVAGAYSVSTLMGYESSVEQVIRLFLERIDQLFIQTGNECPLHDWLQFYAYDVIGIITMSRPMGFMKAGEDIDGILKQMHVESEYRAMTAQMPILDWIFRKNAVVRQFRAPTHKVMIRAKKMLEERLNEDHVRDEYHKDFISRFLEAKEKHSEVLNHRNMMGFVGSNLQAGSDTTAIVLRTILYHVNKDRRVLNKLREELDEKVTYDQLPFQEAFNSLPYTDAVIRESRRIYPPFAMLLERFVPESGLELSDGTFLPPKTVVGSFGYTVHFNKQIYGEDADLFKPERWLQGENENDEDFKNRLHQMNHYDLTFGIGSRQCIGRHIAELQIYKFVPIIFRYLDIEFVNPNGTWTTHQQFFSLQSNMHTRIKWRKDFFRAQLLHDDEKDTNDLGNDNSV